MSIKPGPFAIVAALIVGLTGCGTSATTGSGDTTSSTSSPSPTTLAMSTPPEASPSANASAAEPVLITIKDFKYTIPASVAPGAAVTVKNEDSEAHTVTSATAGAFAVNVTSGGTATFKAPTKPGVYKLICTFHGNMMGTLVVK